MHIGEKATALESKLESFVLDRLRQHLVHAEFKALGDVRAFRMPSYCRNKNLVFYPQVQLSVVKVSYLSSAFKPIHERHVAVHQNQLIGCHTIGQDVTFNHLQGLFSIHGCVNLVRVDAKLMNEDCSKGINIEHLVVYY